MASTKNSIIIPVDDRDPEEYLADLLEAISEIKMLVFSQQTLELQEAQCFALYTLSEFQKQICKNSCKT